MPQSSTGLDKHTDSEKCLAYACSSSTNCSLYEENSSAFIFFFHKREILWTGSNPPRVTAIFGYSVISGAFESGSVLDTPGPWIRSHIYYTIYYALRKCATRNCVCLIRSLFVFKRIAVSTRQAPAVIYCCCYCTRQP